jgi:hypothetical protein
MSREQERIKKLERYYTDLNADFGRLHKHNALMQSVFGMSDINFKSSNVNGDPFSSLFWMIFCALRSLIPVIPFNSSKDALLILIGVVILNYIDFVFVCTD